MTASRPVALVTGANRGIGYEVARQLVEHGYDVLVGGRSDAAAIDAASAIADETSAAGRAAGIQLDVADPDSIHAAIELIGSETGRLDVVVNNAAIHYDSGQRAVDPDFRLVHEALETNTIGAWRTAVAAIPLLRRSAHARIVNVSSGGGALSEMGGGTPAYSVSKAALNAVTLMLADELRSDDVLVNAVCPGWVATDMGGSGGRPVAEGASGIVWAATLPDDGPTGGFFRDRQRIDW